MSAGVLGQQIGGREALRIMAILYIVSAIGCAFAWNWPALMVFRFIGGLGIGGSSVLGPVYIAELAPAKWRGRMVGLFQINIVIGILLAYLSNYLISLLNLGAIEWRWQLGVAGIPFASSSSSCSTRIPRSSRWLVTQNRTDEACDVLELMGSPDSEAELREIMDSIHMERGTAAEPLFQRRYRLPIFLAITIGLFNQLSGINAILYYSNYIFAAAGFSQLSGALQAVSHRRHEPARHLPRHVAHRQARTQDPAAHRQPSARPSASPASPRSSSPHSHLERCSSGCLSPTSPSSPSRRAPSSGSISPRSSPPASAPRARASAPPPTGS